MKAFFITLIAFFTALSGLITNPQAVNELKNKGTIEGFSQTVTADKELPFFTTDENGDFTVLQFSDTHFTTGISFGDLTVLNKMKSKVTELKPDLVVVSGDMIDDGDNGLFNKANVLRSVAEMFDSLEQYWAYIPGNNDGMNYGTCSDIVSYLSQYEYCLVGDDEAISGAAQYSLDIYNGQKLVHSLVFLDTMDYDSEDPDHIYGYVHEDQVQWCKNEIESKKAESEDVFISVFIHENTPEFFEAAERGEAYNKTYPTITKEDEKYNIPKNQPLDDVFAESGCVGLVSMGHKHPATVQCSYYNSTYYHITPKASVGSTLITLHTAADNTRSMYDFSAVY